MEIEQFYNMYNNNIHSILNSEMLDTISNRANFINGYSFINRLMIYIQNKYANNVMGINSWELAGRTIGDDSYKIWIVKPIYKTYYYDHDSKESISKSDLNPIELAMGVKIGSIDKILKQEDIKIDYVYNVNDTVEYDDELARDWDKQIKETVKISKLLFMCSQDFGINILKSKDESYFNENEDILYIGSDSLESKIDAIAISMIKHINIQSISEVYSEGIQSDIIDNMGKLCDYFIYKSIKTFIIKDNIIDNNNELKRIDSLKLYNDNNFKYFIDTFEIVYRYVENIIYMMDESCRQFNDSTINKAGELLTILEASYEINRLNNGEY